MLYLFLYCAKSLVTFNIQNFSDGIYLKDFFSTFSQWVSFPFGDIILHEILHEQNFIAADNISYIQYWSVDGKYRIYLTRLRNGVKDELLASLFPRFAPSQINSIFTVNRPILYLSCNPRCPKKSS